MYKSQLFEPRKDNDDECDDLDAESEDSFNIMSEDDTPREITEKFKLAKIIDKIRESVKKFKYSPVKCDDILTKYLPKDKHNKTYSLIFDMKTRWSSTYKMLERFEIVGDGLPFALIAVKSDIQFSPSEMSIITSLTKYLKYISVTLSAMYSRKASLINLDNRIHALLTKIDEGTEMGSELANFISKRIDERRTVASSALHFFFKGGDNNLHNKIARHDNDQIADFINKVIQRLIPVKDADHDKLSEKENSDLINVESGDSFENFSTAFDKKQCVEAVPIVKSDLLKEIEEMRSSNKRGALLEKVHDFLLNIQVTSVEAERSFSVAGRICTKINSRLGDESINVLSMLYAKFRAIEIAEERATQKPVEKNTAKKRNNSQAIPCPVNEDPEHGVAAKKVRGKK